MSPERSVSSCSTFLDDWFDAFCECALSWTLLYRLCAPSELAWLVRDSFLGIFVGKETALKFGESPIVPGGK
jgi:hypothetical protein